MNLFRSEQHVKGWNEWDESMAWTLHPVEWWIETFRNPLFRNRSRPDYLSWLTTDEGTSATVKFTKRIEQ